MQPLDKAMYFWTLHRWIDAVLSHVLSFNFQGHPKEGAVLLILLDFYFSE